MTLDELSKGMQPVAYGTAGLIISGSLSAMGYVPSRLMIWLLYQMPFSGMYRDWNIF